MRKIKLFIGCVVLLSGTVNAQTGIEKTIITNQTNVAALTNLSASLKTSFDANRSLALQLAPSKNWPITKINPDSSYSQLMGVTDNLEPIYYTTLNYGAAKTARADKLYTGGGLGLNVNGEDMTAHVWDVTVGRPDHELFTNRLIVADDIPETYATHSTHVSGTIIGATGIGINGTRIPQGVAYKAQIRSYDFVSDLSEMATAAADGMLISNISYTSDPSGIGGLYGAKAQQLDVITGYSPFYLPVFAGGNFGSAGQYAKPVGEQLNSNGCAKNAILVASVKELLNYTGPSSVVFSNFSSAGPSDDYRIKPDICAKGTNTYSSYATSSTSYGFLSGTSMAAPSVSGTLLLLQQHYKNLHGGNFMRSSTLRGLVIHTADEAGSTDGPDYQYGWGLINAEKAANVISNSVTSTTILENTLVNSTSFTQNAVAAATTTPLVATICWTDPASVAQTVNNDHAARLVNDLDLRIVSSDGITYYPWKVDENNPNGLPILGDNTRDNVEKVQVTNPNVNVTYKVIVTHKSNLQASLPQKYSLIITGASSTPCQSLVPVTEDVLGTAVVHKQASGKITASNTVSSTAQAIYHATDEVVLTNGFTAVNGSVFRGYIEGCSYSFVKSLHTSSNSEVDESKNDTITTSQFDLVKNGVTILPNPTTGLISIQHPNETQKIEIYNLFGKLLLSTDASKEGTTSVDITEFSSGMYLLKVDNKIQQRVVKL